MNPLSDLERLVAAIEKQGANIAPTYQEYMPIAFAIANDCGEAGRTFFHRICRMSEKYVSTEADKLYDHALKGGNGRNGLGSVFHLADLAGVKLDKSLAEAGKLSNFQTFTPPSHTHTCTHEEQSVKNVPPAFPEYPWPAFLKRMIDRGDTPAQRISSCWEVSPCWERHSTNRSGYRTGENSTTLACKRSSSPLPPREREPSLGHAGLPSRYMRR